MQRGSKGILRIFPGGKTPSQTLIPRGDLLFALLTIDPFSLSFISRQFTARSRKSGEFNAVLKVYSEYLQVENALLNAHPA
jgi:hypothetical protein